MKCWWSVFFLFVCLRSVSQSQTCPLNINFGTTDLTHWYAYTGNNADGNGPQSIIVRYDSTSPAPYGTIGNRSILEYNLGAIYGIQVVTSSTIDPFGGFSTIPVINGYNYGYSIKLGSTAITRGSGPSNLGGGGYVRGVSYSIHVPPGPATVPYTMTYAYAMVLENGTHISSQQPLISVTIKTPAGVLACASPSYFLPTFNNVSELNGRGATLDSATAKKNGFRVSQTRSPNANPNATGIGIEYLQDVWTKNWTEVTYDLSAYRGQQVTITFEADNCVPGGHFSYAYLAIRNNCAGLQISGDSVVCNNSFITYSVPTLADATYDWIVPGSWTVISGANDNIVQVKSSSAGGVMSVRETNSCADLTATFQIATLPSPVGGSVNGSNTVCEGDNSSLLNLVNYSGNIQHWQSSSDGDTWTAISDTNAVYNADNLQQSTLFRAVVVKGTVCPADTSVPAAITVDKKSIGGQLGPLNATLCAGQTAGEILTLTNNNGSVQQWQYSVDGTNWTDLTPATNSPVNTIKGITVFTQYRTIVKNGVCPTDTSAVAGIQFDPVSFPQASASPADTTICYGTAATLNAHIDVGTSYAWTPGSSSYSDIGNIPFNNVNTISPDNSGYYVLHVMNSGCPNPYLDSLHVEVLDPVIVHAGRDTSVVAGEPLQFNATSSDPGPDSFSWVPATDLSDAFIPNPVAVYTLNDNVMSYLVKAVTPFGCSGTATVNVKIFKSKPDIFVPNAFTPGLSMNALFRPIPVGISYLEYFRIYNRLGELVYNTSTIGNGWDGNLNGSAQNAGGYVWMVKGTDYLGHVITKKGTMVLIR